MTDLRHIKMQYLCTNMMQFVTLKCMHVRLSILCISCFPYCICWFHTHSQTWCILQYIHVFHTYSAYIRDLRARQQVFPNPSSQTKWTNSWKPLQLQWPWHLLPPFEQTKSCIGNLQSATWYGQVAGGNTCATMSSMRRCSYQIPSFSNLSW